MRLATNILPVPSPATLAVRGERSQVSGGGHHAACSIAHPVTKVDRAGRPGGAGRRGRVRDFTRAARAGRYLVVAGLAARVVRQLGGGQPGRGHGGRRDLHGLRRHHARPGLHQPEREDLAGDGSGPGRQCAELRAPHCRGGHPSRPDGRGVGELAVRDLHRHAGGGGASGRRQLEHPGHPQHELDLSDGGLVLGTDGVGNVIAGWSTNPGDATDAVLPAGSSSWGPATTLSIEGSVGQAHSLSLAVNSGGSAIITFNGGLNNLWAVSGTVTGGFSPPVMLASGSGSNKYNPIGTSEVALNNAGQASVVWSVLDGHTGVLTRSPSGAWSGETVLTTRTAPTITVSTAIDGAGNAIAVFGSSYTWDLAGGSWKTPASLPPGSSGGLAVADQAGTFVYADTTGNAFTFTAGAASFGTGSGSHTSLGDLKIVPGQAVMLASDAVSAEPVS